MHPTFPLPRSYTGDEYNRNYEISEISVNCIQTERLRRVFNRINLISHIPH